MRFIDIKVRSTVTTDIHNRLVISPVCRLPKTMARVMSTTCVSGRNAYANDWTTSGRDEIGKKVPLTRTSV